MSPAPLRPTAAREAAPQSAPPAQPARYLTNDEAAAFLRLSPRTLEKQRVIGGGPRFRKFGPARHVRRRGPRSLGGRPQLRGDL